MPGWYEQRGGGGAEAPHGSFLHECRQLAAIDARLCHGFAGIASRAGAQRVSLSHDGIDHAGRKDQTLYAFLVHKLNDGVIALFVSNGLHDEGFRFTGQRHVLDGGRLGGESIAVLQSGVGSIKLADGFVLF